MKDLSLVWLDKVIVAIQAKQDIQGSRTLPEVIIPQSQLSQDGKLAGAHSIVTRVTSSNEGDDTNRKNLSASVRKERAAGRVRVAAVLAPDRRKRKGTPVLPDTGGALTVLVTFL